MDKKQRRFYFSARITIKDKLFKDTMVINSKSHGETPDGLIRKVTNDSKKYIKTLSKPRGITQENINGLVEELRRDGWGKRRIKNHFAKFGIDINLSEQKNKIDSNQSKLPLIVSINSEEEL